MNIASASNAIPFFNGVTVNDWIVGIISGIISSLIITVFYRKIDNAINKERDRQLFFSELREFSRQLSADVLNVQEIDHLTFAKLLENFYTRYEFPRQFRWVKLTKEEEYRIVNYSFAYYYLLEQSDEYIKEYDRLMYSQKEKGYCIELLEREEKLDNYKFELLCNDLSLLGKEPVDVQKALDSLKKRVEKVDKMLKRYE